jgi:hypothetical protein
VIRSLALAAALLAVGCSDPFDPAFRVTKTRLLAVSADHPYAHEGETVTLRALATGPSALTFGWATCFDPPSATVAGCLAAFDRSTVVLGSARLEHTIVARGTMVGVLVVACPGALDASLTCTSGGRALRLDEYEVGMKRIVVRARDRNENPSASALTFDGADWPETRVPELDPCDPGDTIDDCPAHTKHRIDVTPATIESGVDELGVAFTEQVLVQYYATEGTFDSSVRTAAAPATDFVARRRAAGSTIEFFFVVRDDRGGVSWTTRRARVR